VRGAGVSDDDGKDAYLITMPVPTDNIGNRSVFVSDKLRGVREVIVCAVF
jgi:hypothetical protein